MTRRDLENIKETIDSVNMIDEEKCWLLTNDSNQKYCLVKESDKFLMKRNIRTDENLENRNFRLENLNNKTFKCSESDLEIVVIDSIFKSHNWIESISFGITSFETRNFRSNSFFQLVFLSDNKKLDIQTVFDCLISVNTDSCINLYNGIAFNVQDIEFNLYLAEGYLIVENLDKLEFEKFNGYVRKVLLSFGFLTGYVPMEKGYYFSYKDNKFNSNEEFAYYEDFASTYISSLKPIDTGLFYSYMQNSNNEETRKELEDKYEKDLYKISKDIFSNLCNLSIENKKFARVIELVLEANQPSLEVQGIAYSVVLEILSNYNYEKNPEKLKPIADKKQAKELIQSLHEVAKPKIDDYKNSVIYKKIENLNTPTNKDKLVKQFEILGIELDETDVKIVNHRNNFLHGNDFVEGEEIFEFAKNYLYINLKLNFLVNALILKIAGHKGKIVNRAKVYLEEMSIVENEEIYRNIGY